MGASNLNKPAAWQTALIQAVNNPQELLTMLDLDPALLGDAQAAARLFQLKVPRGFVERMEKGNINDPLLKQILPLGAELITTPGYETDPLQESDVNPIPGLLHKYRGRVLLTLASSCAVNCRFCFRRHFPYSDNNPGTEGWERALNYIAQDRSIVEVILSGGDPLVVNDHSLRLFSDKLTAIPHLKRLRIHTRLPIVLPERITPEFCQWLQALKLKPVLITHANHPREINDAVITAMRALTAAGVTLLNQTVLLKGINDDVATLIALSEAIFAAGIQPYYLHVLDKVQGAAHFDLPLARAQALHWELSQHLSGYLVPKLVYEKPGAPAKMPLELCTD